MIQTTTDLRFLGDWGVWLPVTLALLLAGGAWTLYRREVRGVLPALRATTVFLLVLILTGPVLHHRHTIGELARVLVFVDASQSMDVTDDAMNAPRKLLIAQTYGWFEPTNWFGLAGSAEKLTNAMTAAIEKFDSVSRWQRVERMLLDGVLPALVQKHNVELWAITDTEPQRWWSAEQGLALPKMFPTKPTGAGTDLSATSIGRQSAERTAVVLVSDGQHNRGGSPVELAKIAGAQGVPIFTVGIGALERPPDLAVSDVTAPAAVFIDDRLKGEVAIKDDMPAGQAFTLRIESNGEALWEKALVTDRTHHRKIEFDFPIRELVISQRRPATEYTSFPLEMKVSLTSLTGEKNTTNNVSVFHTRAVTQKRKLLLLDGRPRWEFRYLRNMFERDPQWEVNALVAGTELNDEWQHGDKPGQLPATKEALFAYDLIGFGEVPTKLLKKDDLEWIKEFIGTRGGGIFFVDGQRNLLRAYTEFKSLFPVEWLDKAPKELPAVLQLTDAGTAFGPLRLVGDAIENAALWKKLKPPHWVAATRALPGSETLVETDQKAPVVVLRQYGAGKVLYLGIDDTWRWRFDVADKYQDAFWQQMANAIMEESYAAHNKSMALDAAAVGDTAEIRLRLRDEQGRAITTGRPIAIVTRAGKKIATVPLTESGGAFRGKTATLPPGRYEVRVDGSDLPVEFDVQQKDSRELVELTVNEELLQQMARASGGEYYREEDAARLGKSLEPLSKGRIEESETILWQSWYWFIPIIALLTAEWILRKRSGLI